MIVSLYSTWFVLFPEAFCINFVLVEFGETLQTFHTAKVMEETYLFGLHLILEEKYVLEIFFLLYIFFIHNCLSHAFV